MHAYTPVPHTLAHTPLPHTPTPNATQQEDIKHSYYREHTHAIASGVDPKAVMAELFAKVR